TFRSGVAAIVRRVGELIICGQSGNAREAMDAFRATRPDVVVVDVCLPDLNGIELTRQMCQERPEVRVLILSQHENPLYAAKALRAGARGYLRKDDGLAELALALRRVSRNRVYISKSFQSHVLLDSMARNESHPENLLECLSPREKEVFYCVGRGLPPKDIAQQLRMGLKTVETHRISIKKKLNIPSSTEVNRLAKDWFTLEESTQVETHPQNELGFVLPVTTTDPA
ncbi:response regulator transcription factor, partial [Verrucomicrobium spinosum]